MSEPLTSHEIEDVLSSIRRLVSSDLRPTLKPPVNGAAVEKLLLTPALRVVGDAELVAPVLPESDDLRVDAPDDAGAPMEVLDEEEIQVFFGEAAPLGRSPGGEVYDDADTAEGGSGLRAVIDSRASEAKGAAQPVLFLRSGANIPEVDWSQGEEDWVEDDVAAAPPLRMTAQEEPLARAWADRAEAQIKEELTRPEVVAAPISHAVGAQLVEPQRGETDDDSDADDAWVDEELLRDLVRAIIREELAGSLGERITRNVRKLVRLEVNRALTTRDFE